jgi:hypothetical protein
MDPPGAAGGMPIDQAIVELLRQAQISRDRQDEWIRDQPRGGGREGGMNQQERNFEAARRARMDLMKSMPSFERGKDRWIDFERQVRLLVEELQVPEGIAKRVLFGAIKGRSSRIVIASLIPNEGAAANMTFDQYLREMGQKFTPAAESMQMKQEYKLRKQDKEEDVQSYVNEKYELYKMAYPGNDDDLSDFYVEATKGVANKYVRNNLWSYQATGIADFGQKAVFWVQVERQRITCGDSEGSSLEGLTPVTKITNKYQRAETMEIDHLRRTEEGWNESECECNAMQEQGFRGPCYYCQKKGHMLRSCPRKSAGLPRVRGPENLKSTNPVKKNSWTKGKTPFKKPMGSGNRRVNQIGGEEEDEESDEEGAEDEGIEEEGEDLHFLEERL